MPVNHPVFRVSGKKLVQLVQVLGKVVVLPDGELGDPPAQVQDLFIVKAGHIVVVQKIELDLFPIHGAVEVHDEGLHAAGIHSGHHL